MFLVTETKFDDSIPKVQLFIEGLALLANTIETLKVEDYSCISKKIYHPSVTSWKTNYDIEILLVEINLIKRKWFLNGSYNPIKNQISHHLEFLNRILEEYSSANTTILFS